jgi:Spy/CpxP family protein refolding chaperone
MNRWKQAVVASVFGLFFASVSTEAQISKATIMQEAGKRLDTIAKKLNLSPDQMDKIRPLLGQEMQDITEAKQKYAASDKSDAAKKEAMDSIQGTRDKHQGEIKEILTPEQASKWQDATKGYKDDMNLKKLPKF